MVAATDHARGIDGDRSGTPHAPAPHIRYRADIDGLRAVAVLPVVAYHAGFTTAISGGFVGVDIFFVISGFLITSIILREIDAGSYSIARFYVRRIKRIFPALFATYLAVIVASLLLLFPSETVMVGRSTASSILFVSNIFFWNESSYFSSVMERNPLLHTWSLSVEEQFYIIFPVIALMLKRVGATMRFWALVVIAVVSLIAATWQVSAEPTTAFYLVPYRAWELLAGGLLAALPGHRRIPAALGEAVALAGLALIGGSVLLLTPYTPFPGLAALPACLGSAMVIWAGTDRPTLVGRGLALPPVRFVGLISYSLYLVHWPIMVFGKLVAPATTPSAKLALIAASVVVATLFWRFIERPFRAPGSSDRRVLGWGIAAMLAGLALAAMLPMIARTVSRTPAEAERLLAFEEHDVPAYMRIGSCFLTSQFRDPAAFDDRTCLTPDSTRPTYLILGDSHAADLWYGLQHRYPRFHFLQATASGCKPVARPVGEDRCTVLINRVVNEFLPRHRVDGIIVSARWLARDADGALAMVTRLRRHADRVILLGPVPEYRQPLPRVLARAVVAGVAADRYAAAARTDGPLDADRRFAALALPGGVRYVSSYAAMTDGRCPVIVDRAPVQFDYGHLTKAGSSCLAAAMNLASRPAVPPSPAMPAR